MAKLEVMTAEPASGLDLLVGDYLAAVRARGLSPKTIDVYENALRRVLLPFCAERGIREPGELDSKALDRLSTHLLTEPGSKGRPLSRTSVRSYLGTIGHFLAWAREEGELPEGARIKRPSAPQRVLDVLTRSEIARLEDAAEVERDKLIIRILADSGMRLSELTGLRTGDLVEQGRYRFVRVRGKGRGGQNQERLVPLAPALWSRLRRYAERGRPRDVGTDRIFIARRRRDGNYAPLDPRAVQDMVRFAGERAGLSQRVHPHLLRHSFATWCLQSPRNMNPLQLQKILGHSDLTMITRTYSHLVASDTAEALMAALRADE